MTGDGFGAEDGEAAGEDMIELDCIGGGGGGGGGGCSKGCFSGGGETEELAGSTGSIYGAGGDIEGSSLFLNSESSRRAVIPIDEGPLWYLERAAGEELEYEAELGGEMILD